MVETIAAVLIGNLIFYIGSSLYGIMFKSNKYEEHLRNFVYARTKQAMREVLNEEDDCQTDSKA